MPLCTYIYPDEVERIRNGVTDKDVLEWLGYARELGFAPLIEERTVTVRRWFRSHRAAQSYKQYCVYYYVGADFQVMNFCGGESSIHNVVSKEVVVAYLMGLVNGAQPVNLRQAKERS